MATETLLGTAAVIPRGEYDSAAQYKRANVVRANNRSYMAILPSQGIPVSNALYWLELVTPTGAPIRFGTEFPDDENVTLLLDPSSGGVYVEDLPARSGGTLGERFEALDNAVMLAQNNEALASQYKNEANQYRQEAAESAQTAQGAAQSVQAGVEAHNGSPDAHAALFAGYYTKAQIDQMLAQLAGQA